MNRQDARSLGSGDGGDASSGATGLTGTSSKSFSPALRESIAALISLGIAVIALWLLVDTYLAGRQIEPADERQQRLHQDAYTRQKDLLLYALALLGTVTGYYLGRVPAELHAEKASREARQAEAREAETKRVVRTSIRAIKAKSSATASRGAGIRDAGAGTLPESSVAADLDALLERLEE